MSREAADTVRLLCILGIVLTIGLPFLFAVKDDDEAMSGLVKHISCKDLKPLTNSSNLQEQNIVKSEYATRC